MSELDLTEAAAWAIIVSGAVYALVSRYGHAAAAVGAAIAALAVKTVLLDVT